MKRVAVIGGGISGLSTAFLLKRKGIDVTVFESSATFGGNLQTIEQDGYNIELGPNSLLRAPHSIEIIRLLHLEKDVLSAAPAAKKRYVLLNGRLRALGPASLFNGYFSLKTLGKLVREPLLRSKSPEHESLAAFVERRLGTEVLDRAVDPFVSGIYAGDPRNLSIRAAFPKLFEMERDFGSLIVGAFRGKGAKPDQSFPRTFSFRGGVKRLVSRLVEVLGESALRPGVHVNTIGDSGSGRFEVNGRDFDAVVASTPAWAAADLIRAKDPDLAVDLAAVFYPQLAVAITGFRAEQIGKPLDGFGFLVPSKEKRPILGTLFISSIFPDRAPEGRHLLTTFLGGVNRGKLLDLMSDEDLKSTVTGQLADILKISGEPELFHIKRWKRAIPQYQVGYEDVLAKCESFEHQNLGIFFCSNFYRGISVGDCIKNAFSTADRVEESLKK